MSQVSARVTVHHDLPNEDITPEYVTQRLVLAGTVDSVVDPLLAFREQVGDFGTLLYAGHDWIDPVLAKPSMQVMAEQVMPRVNAAIEKSTGGCLNGHEVRSACLSNGKVVRIAQHKQSLFSAAEH